MEGISLMESHLSMGRRVRDSYQQEERLFSESIIFLAFTLTLPFIPPWGISLHLGIKNGGGMRKPTYFKWQLPTHEFPQFWKIETCSIAVSLKGQDWWDWRRLSQSLNIGSCYPVKTGIYGSRLLMVKILKLQAKAGRKDDEEDRSLLKGSVHGQNSLALLSGGGTEGG